MATEQFVIEKLNEFIEENPELEPALKYWLSLVDEFDGNRNMATSILQSIISGSQFPASGDPFDISFRTGGGEGRPPPVEFIRELPQGVDVGAVEAIAREASRLETSGPEEEVAEAKAETAVLVEEYQEAGFQDIQVTDSGEIFAWNPETASRSLKLNAEEFESEPLSQGVEVFDPATRLPIPAIPPGELPYMLDPTYEINIDIDQYFSMLRWLDPLVKERVEDSARVQLYFEGVAARDEALETRADRIAARQEGGVLGKVGSGIGPGRGGIPFGQAGFVPYVPPTIAIGGKYADGDEARLFVTKSTGYVSYIQGLMLKGNILTKTDIAEGGRWGMAEEAAIKPHLFAADRRGLSIRQWLVEVSENPLPETQPTGFTQPVYNAPDFATMSQNVKGAFRTQLGREPEPYEMGDLIMQLEQDHFADYQGQVDAARMEWNARQAAVETGAEQTTGSVRDVDPFSRMKEAFDKKFGPERERQEDVAEHGANVGLLMNSLAGIEQQVGG